MPAKTSLSRPQRLRLLTVIGGVLALVTLAFLISSSSLPPSLRSSSKSISHFHLVLPATAATIDLCRLLLSCAVTGYPDPIFLGWGGHGAYDGAKSHLFKISETLAYLNSLPPSADDDLVLLLDGYDIFMQLRPDVLIRRYWSMVDRANARLNAEGILDKDYGGSRVRQTIFFGPDKICWPTYPKRPACWAVPESSLDKMAFGPNTDRDMIPNRPRWLNSGTIMGPAKDMRDMFQGVMSMLNRKYDESFTQHNSDQYYFQEVWGEQEIARIQLRDGKVEPPEVDDGFGDVPDLSDGRRTEYHIALDYASELFQTNAAYAEFCTWMRYNHSSGSTPLLNDINGVSIPHPDEHLRLDQFSLPQEVVSSSPPISLKSLQSLGLPLHTGWKEMMLGVNTVTQQPFPMFHMTGDKTIRERWWPRMWFHPHGEALLKASKSSDQQQQVGDGVLIAEVDGIKYVGARVPGSPPLNDGQGANTKDTKPNKGGGWSDQGEWISWDTMCATHESTLFLTAGDR
ncbi:Hypothetical protein R9X50_00249000 [Acrodontium crateriforme]|uniref:Uncharacterized protein n=1 Tax=Acrodontium crateriforme TaxID=150365 RepID=A0AAQ3M725_9PEZI|nr:Hypothetical protein R9X50_00249000 [Acrodontium crateriforme]